MGEGSHVEDVGFLVGELSSLGASIADYVLYSFLEAVHTDLIANINQFFTIITLHIQLLQVILGLRWRLNFLFIGGCCADATWKPTHILDPQFMDMLIPLLLMAILANIEFWALFTVCIEIEIAFLMALGTDYCWLILVGKGLLFYLISAAIL
jgi:hypothetical protein